ncbi:MAG: peptidylprolyl isomerase [Vicinamibacterales bacterium]
MRQSQSKRDPLHRSCRAAARLFISCLCVAASLAVLQGQRAGSTSAKPPSGPVLTMVVDKGTIEIQLFRADAPKSVEHILGLVGRSFYRGQRIHRVERSLVQFGDPTSRDVSRRDWWGSGGSRNPIGVAEFNTHRHVRGAVGLAHAGNARAADSQIYILKAPMPALDGKHVVVGQVIKGMEVVDTLQVLDLIKNFSVR